MPEKSKKFETRKLTVTALLFALIFVLQISGIGIIPVGLANATVLHIPVIIGSVVEGPIIGAILGLLFGLLSLWNSFAKPTPPWSLAFNNPLCSVLPRILIGITSYFTYVFCKKLFKKIPKNELVAALFSSIIGTLTNTVLVLVMVYVLYGNLFNENAKNISAGAFLTGVGIVNGPPEIILAALICTPIITVVKTKVRK